MMSWPCSGQGFNSSCRQLTVFLKYGDLICLVLMLSLQKWKYLETSRLNERIGNGPSENKQRDFIPEWATKRKMMQNCGLRLLKLKCRQYRWIALPYARESIDSTFNLYTQPRVRVAEADKERKRRGKITREWERNETWSVGDANKRDKES